VTKWQPIVKANREAPTLKFATGREDVPRTTTTAALTAKFAPSREFEKQIAELLQAGGAHNEQAVQEAEEALALKVLLCSAPSLSPGEQEMPHRSCLQRGFHSNCYVERVCQCGHCNVEGGLLHLSLCATHGNAACI
jgi:hypothetical protein